MINVGLEIARDVQVIDRDRVMVMIPRKNNQK